MTRRRLGPAERREQLLGAALELAAGRDLTSLSVQEIATHAGVSEGLLYHYFPNKDALLLAAVQRAADAMTDALEGAVHGEPLAALLAGLGAYLDHVQADPNGWRALLQARSGALADVATAVEQRSRRLVLGSLGVPTPSPALRMVLEGWSALERQVCLDWLASPEVTRAAVEDLLLSNFLGLLQAAARHDDQVRDVLDRLTPGG
ncbi:MAG TPA: TetR/AcrR family transcriptional regulator [Mycobacteriales bacterium]|nr:TetR/AcrR family transcriptional regulator [Mycobacteriales bacterium]